MKRKCYENIYLVLFQRGSSGSFLLQLINYILTGKDVNISQYGHCHYLNSYNSLQNLAIAPKNYNSHGQYKRTIKMLKKRFGSKIEKYWFLPIIDPSIEFYTGKSELDIDLPLINNFNFNKDIIRKNLELFPNLKLFVINYDKKYIPYMYYISDAKVSINQKQNKKLNKIYNFHVADNEAFLKNIENNDVAIDVKIPFNKILENYDSNYKIFESVMDNHFLDTMTDVIRIDFFDIIHNKDKVINILNENLPNKYTNDINNIYDKYIDSNINFVNKFLPMFDFDTLELK